LTDTYYKITKFIVEFFLSALYSNYPIVIIFEVYWSNLPVKTRLFTFNKYIVYFTACFGQLDHLQLIQYIYIYIHAHTHTHTPHTYTQQQQQHTHTHHTHTHTHTHAHTTHIHTTTTTTTHTHHTHAHTHHTRHTSRRRSEIALISEFSVKTFFIYWSSLGVLEQTWRQLVMFHT